MRSRSSVRAARWRRSRVARGLIALVVAVPGGFALLWPTAAVCDVAGISVCNTWALSHALAPLLWCVFSIALFALVWAALRQLNR